jgi:hypothetical protein
LRVLKSGTARSVPVSRVRLPTNPVACRSAMPNRHGAPPVQGRIPSAGRISGRPSPFIVRRVRMAASMPPGGGVHAFGYGGNGVDVEPSPLVPN